MIKNNTFVFIVFIIIFHQSFSIKKNKDKKNKKIQNHTDITTFIFKKI